MHLLPLCLFYVLYRGYRCILIKPLKALVQLYPSLTAAIKCTLLEMFILKAAR